MEEIKETEIRIVGQSQPYKPQPNLQPADGIRPLKEHRHLHRRNGSECNSYIPWKWIIFIFILFAGIVSLYFMWRANNDEIIQEDVELIDASKGENLQLNSSYNASSLTEKNISNSDNKILTGNYCDVNRVIVNDVPIKIFDPGNAAPKLHVGKLETSDSHIILACQAADIREDNGGIVGAFIDNGTIISKGLSKVGFVAIINGKIKIGAELNSPYFEEAIQTNGSFFRQYALVKDGMLIENNLNNKSIRRAVCELNGSIIVAETESRESFHDFSQALIDYGVQNAVYLVGGTSSHGFCRLNSETLNEWGNSKYNNEKNVTYIVWESL